MANFDPVRDVMFVGQLREVDDADAGGNRRGPNRLVFGVFSPGVVIVGGNDDMPTADIFFTAGRQPITRTPKRECLQSSLRQRLYVLLAFGPINRLITFERIWPTK